MNIQVLGTGCPKCIQLMKQTERAVAELGLPAEVGKVSEIDDILAFGIMMIPALAIDGKIKLVGNVPPLNELKEIIKKG